MTQNLKAEKAVAVGSFLAAVLMAFTSVIISDDHDIAAGVLMMCAQFLTLTATIFGIDYKWNFTGKHKVDNVTNRDDDCSSPR